MSGVSAAVREKGAELENILLEEKKKAEDLNNKLTFYGGAYSKLSNKLQGTSVVCIIHENCLYHLLHRFVFYD